MREFKRKNRGVRLSDGKVASGKGRLTDTICDKIQNYFGTAIRENVGNKDGMKKAVWTIYKHVTRNDNESLEKQQDFCPKSKTHGAHLGQKELSIMTVRGCQVSF